MTQFGKAWRQQLSRLIWHTGAIRVPAVITLVMVITTVAFLSPRAALGQGTNGERLKPKSPSLAQNDYEFNDEPLRGVIGKLAEDSKLNVAFDAPTEKSIGDTTVTMTLKDVTSPRALEIVLGTYGLLFAQLDRRTIVVSKEKRWRDPDVPLRSVVLRAEIEEAEQSARGEIPVREDPKVDVDYQGASLHSAIMMLGQRARIKILFDPAIEESAKQTSVGLSLPGVTIPGALRFILDAYGLEYDQIDQDTINIVAPSQPYSSVPLGDIIRGRK